MYKGERFDFSNFISSMIQTRRSFNHAIIQRKHRYCWVSSLNLKLIEVCRRICVVRFVRLG